MILPGDRYIMRGSYAIQTLGGGTVLDIAPGRHKRMSDGLDAVHDLLRRGSVRQKAEYHVEKGGYKGLSRDYLAMLLGLKKQGVDSIVDELVREKKVRAVAKTLVKAERS